MSDFTREERDNLLKRAWEIDGRLYAKESEARPQGRERAQLKETYYRILSEYADRLPRVMMSACPHSGEILKRSFDPWGLDGPWWHKDQEVRIEEPAAPASFKVLLGAFSLNGRDPEEVRAPVIPGPEVPFVVPALLKLPGMVAVVSRLETVRGGVAYPVGYFSTEEIQPDQLHQFWLRQDFWFTQEDGTTAWLTANDRWDFDLGPWVESGKLRWIEPGDREGTVRSASDTDRCPFVDLPGDRFPQVMAWGTRDLLDLPDGSLVNPFED